MLLCLIVGITLVYIAVIVYLNLKSQMQNPWDKVKSSKFKASNS